MADSRTKTHTVLLTVNSKKKMLELFAADLWPEQGAREGLWRVRIDGRWHCPLGKYSFLTLAAVAELTASLLAGGVLVEPEALPDWVRKGVDVRAHGLESLESAPVQTSRGYTVDDPQLGPDGRWHVLCQLFTRGKRFMPVADLSPVRV